MRLMIIIKNDNKYLKFFFDPKDLNEYDSKLNANKIERDGNKKI